MNKIHRIHCFGMGVLLGMAVGAGIFVLVWRFAP
jgi:hypothetical protein